MMTGSETERRINAEELLAVVKTVFQRCAKNERDAALLADSLVNADLGGVHSHGVLRVPEYVKELTVASVNPRGRPEVVRDSGACLVVDGGNSMGQVGAHFAMERVIGRTETTGITAAIRVAAFEDVGRFKAQLDRARSSRSTSAGWLPASTASTRRARRSSSPGSPTAAMAFR